MLEMLIADLRNWNLKYGGLIPFEDFAQSQEEMRNIIHGLNCCAAKQNDIQLVVEKTNG